jgi:ATP-dependent DNA helicase RecG
MVAAESPRETARGAAVRSELESRPLSTLRGVGPALAATLERIGLVTVQDLLFHLPLRYEDRTRVVPIGALRNGERAVVEGEVQLAEIVFRRRRALLCRIADGSGFLTLRFFHFSAAQQQGLARGVRLRCYGEARLGPGGLEIVHPEYRILGRPDTAAPPAEGLTPVYSVTEGIQQGRMRNLASLALAELRTGTLRDWLGSGVLDALDLPTLDSAVRFVHRPPGDADLEELNRGRHPAQRRLAFEELLAHQLSLRLLRKASDLDQAWDLPPGGDLVDRLCETLPFRLTGAQRRAWSEIERDLARPQPMMRLVLGVRVALLTGRHARRTRANLLRDLATGDVRVAVGTHALFQQGVEFSRLAIAIVDEQHRFGVHQRLQLREKGRADDRYPHQLVMTATPIPRTLAMTAYADLDVSVIDELPPGRTPIRTVAMPETRRDEVVARIHAACAAGRQAYWVCPLIDESELVRHQAAEETAAALAVALPELRVGLVHGRMPATRKDTVMQAFKGRRLDLLVATTVIEVGVDVPNASLMVIENAERMGLSQLHQLRGRVGRGEVESTCVLLYKPSLSPLARERLAVLRDTTDGFAIARRDLELRGPGELLGTRQTGLMQMRVADLVRDSDLLPDVQRAATLMLDGPADSVSALLRRWVGDGTRFSKV